MTEVEYLETFDGFAKGLMWIMLSLTITPVMFADLFVPLGLFRFCMVMLILVSLILVIVSAAVYRQQRILEGDIRAAIVYFLYALFSILSGVYVIINL